MNDHKLVLDKAYEAKKFEKNIYQIWEDSGFFNPDNLKTAGKPFVVSMPPPNVTGVLHLGHAMENALMDTEIRYQRLRGRKALLVPGTDHAAVATQARVEKDLIASGKYKNPRQELGREKLLNIIRDYADQARSTILQQIRQMGTSCDWSRLAYTFDEQRSQAVGTIFAKMYKDGLIYRGYRVVNWSVAGQSTCSDDEIEYKEQLGKLYYFKYSKAFPITIATTRPETKLGDTAVAVNPKDKRYKKYIGRTFSVDIGAARPLEIKIIADTRVDLHYGTGALGVTPAHSSVDFEMYEKRLGKKEEIKLIPVIDQKGLMTEQAGPAYAGLTVMAAREKFVAWLRKNNLLEKEEDVLQNVGTADRFSDVVEALPMRQWFVAVNKKIPSKNKSLKELMRAAVTTGHKGKNHQIVRIYPTRYKKAYLHWIDNLRDWCISRQIWWGHRIPVWYCMVCEDPTVKHIIDQTGQVKQTKIVLKRNTDSNPIVSIERPQKCNVCGNYNSNLILQDPDTLDTWFSSALWTFSTLGWPKKTNDLRKFHPTSWMQMGYEILFFWMARMILMSTYVLDEIPFRDVYIHGVLRNEQGQKFSKSLRNAIEPLQIIEKYGTDALRLAMIIGSAAGADMRFSEERVMGTRNFVNKLWNISRFIFSNVTAVKIIKNKPKPKTLADRWILAEFEQLVIQAGKYLDEYKFSPAAEALYDFTWTKLADWYLEIAKIEKNKDQILLYILQRLLILWHPFTPFVTEVLWRQFDNKNLLMVQEWPKVKKVLAGQIIKDFTELQSLVIKIRNLKAENKIAPADKPDCYLTSRVLSKNDLSAVAVLARVNMVSKLGQAKVFKTAGSQGQIRLIKTMSAKERSNLENYIKSLETKLANEKFLSQAPKHVVSKTREDLKKARASLG